MAVPKRKTSPSRRGMRRSADALKAPTYIEDKEQYDGQLCASFSYVLLGLSAINRWTLSCV